MTRPWTVGPLLLTLAIALHTPASAQTGPSETVNADTFAAALAELERAPNTIVAEVGGRTVTRGDAADSIRAMPPATALRPFQGVFLGVLAQLMRDEAMAARGGSAGLTKLPTVQRSLRNAAEYVLADAFLRRALAPNLTDAALRPIYEATVAKQSGPEEVHVRIAATDTRSDASILVERVHNGSSFDNRARLDSVDPSRVAGGDLGYIRHGMLEPPLDAIVFSLGIGQVTTNPTPIGPHWFVATVDARRVGPRPARGDAPDTEFDIGWLQTLRRVGIANAGNDRAAVRAFVAAGARGIVSAGFAPGGPDSHRRPG